MMHEMLEYCLVAIDWIHRSFQLAGADAKYN